MDKKICIRCDKEYSGSGFMWDFQKNGKQYCCEVVCQECDKEINPSRYREDDKDKQIAELQEKLSAVEREREQFAEGYSDVRDKLHRRNLQIADLKKEVNILKDVLSKKQDIISKLAKHPLLKDIDNKDMEKYLTVNQ